MTALKVIAEASEKLLSAIKILLISRNEPDIRAELISATFSIDINKVDKIDEVDEVEEIDKVKEKYF